MEHSPDIKLSESAENALEMSLTNPNVPVIAAGSFYLVGKLMHLLGINHERLTFRKDSIDRRLTDVHGKVIPEILA